MTTAPAIMLDQNARPFGLDVAAASVPGNQDRVPIGDVDAIVVVPPPSPSDTNPPLGPAIISRVASRYGLRVGVIDLNIRFIRKFVGLARPRGSFALGDHGKDRRLVAAAADWFFSHTPLGGEPPMYLPDAANAVAGMHYSFASIARALDKAAAGEGPWRSWLESDLLDGIGAPVPTLGISIMGPSQVFVALLILRLFKQRWPHSTTVLGGSHVTLLAKAIAANEEYRRCVDYVLPGHSEYEFVQLLCNLKECTATVREAEKFEYEPKFDSSELRLYERSRLTLPVQFSRGCSYGRCTFCTYPVVEPVPTSFRPGEARLTIAKLVEHYGVEKFSLKDSLFTAPMMRSFADALLTDPALEIAWSATTKAVRALIPIAEILAASGLRTVELGVETIHHSGQLLFDKRAHVPMMEDVILALAEAGVTVVVNMIFGLPGETLEEAERQLEWYTKLRRRAPEGRIDGSLNMLEIVRGSPLTASASEIDLLGIAPWAYCYQWSAPPWRKEFKAVADKIELA